MAKNACLLVEREFENDKVYRKHAIHKTEEENVRINYLVRRANWYMALAPETYGNFRYFVDAKGFISKYYLKSLYE